MPYFKQKERLAQSVMMRTTRASLIEIFLEECKQIEL